MNIRLRPGTNVFGKPLAVASISISRRHGRVADGAEHGQIDHVIVAEALAPPPGTHALPHCGSPSAFEFDAVPLTIIKAERLNRFITFKCPCEARGGILAAGKQHQSATLEASLRITVKLRE